MPEAEPASRLLNESNLLQRVRWFRVLKLSERHFLPSIHQSHSSRRADKREDLFQLLQIAREHRAQMGVVQKPLPELRYVDGHCDNARIAPVQFGHALGGLPQQQALGVAI